MEEKENLQILIDLLLEKKVDKFHRNVIVSLMHGRRVRTEEAIPMLIEALRTKEFPTTMHVVEEAYKTALKCGYVPMKVYH